MIETRAAPKQFARGCSADKRNPIPDDPDMTGNRLLASESLSDGGASHEGVFIIET